MHNVPIFQENDLWLSAVSKMHLEWHNINKKVFKTRLNWKKHVWSLSKFLHELKSWVRNVFLSSDDFFRWYLNQDWNCHELASVHSDRAVIRLNRGHKISSTFAKFTLSEWFRYKASELLLQNQVSIFKTCGELLECFVFLLRHRTYLFGRNWVSHSFTIKKSLNIKARTCRLDEAFVNIPIRWISASICLLGQTYQPLYWWTLETFSLAKMR
jgi:hypothetical protein